MIGDVPSYAIVIGVVFAILVAVVYFLPAMVANNRRHAGAIKLLNLGLGWTGVGWVGALIWAMRSPKETLQEGNSLRGNAQGGLEVTQVPPLSRGEVSPVLWRQIFGLILASLILLFLGGPWGFLAVLTGVFTFCDAWHAGIYKKKGMRSLLNISPMGWAIVMEGLLIAAYPFLPLQQE